MLDAQFCNFSHFGLSDRIGRWPNLAVNTDTPRAGLRPRSGSPVTFVRSDVCFEFRDGCSGSGTVCRVAAGNGCSAAQGFVRAQARE